MAQRQGKQGIGVCKISTNSNWHRKKKKERSHQVFAVSSKSMALWEWLHIAPCGLALYRLKRQIIFITSPTSQACNQEIMTSNFSLKRGKMRNTQEYTDP